MPVAGLQLSIGWSLALCHRVGFRNKELTTVVALMTAESGRFVEAWHDNINTAGKVDSVDRGLFQINDKWHPDLSDWQAYKPIPNAAYAFKMSSGKYFSPWMAHESGAHLKYVLPVWIVRHLGRWRGKIHRVDKELGSYRSQVDLPPG